MAKKTQYDVTGAIIDYETVGLPEEKEIELFQHLVKTGLAWSLQGSYGRRAKDLICSGRIKGGF